MKEEGQEQHFFLHQKINKDYFSMVGGMIPIVSTMYSLFLAQGYYS